MKTMYPAQVNSPGTELAAAIDAVQDTIQVTDGSVLPDGPNLLTIGTDEAAETILYTGKTGDELTGVTRGFQGTAQSWAVGTKVARYFTAYDHDAAISNISELSTGLTATKDRLDIEERKDVVLNAGIQLLNAQRRAAFSLSGIKGRTLVNLAGRMSNRSVNDPAVTTLSVGNGTTGRNTETVNVSVKNTGEGYITYRQIDVTEYTLIPDKYYLISMDVKINSISGPGQLKAGATWYGAVDVDKTKIGVWQRVYHSIKAVTERTFMQPIVGTCYAGGVFATANFDVKNVSLYEISSADSIEFPLLSPEQKNIKYPYVDSVQPVRNPYAIRYGENLLPPFYEWAIHSTAKIADAYTLVQTATGATQNTNVRIPVRAGETYTLSYLPTEDSNTAYINIQWLDANGASLGYTPKNTNGQTVIAPDGAVIASVLTGNTAAGTFTFKNPMLTLGSTPKPFKPREDSMLALQTDLYADPLIGANADEVFEKDGQYFKLAKWKKVVLDGSIVLGSAASFTGFKVLQTDQYSHLLPRWINYSGVAVKYDGKVLKTATIGGAWTANGPDTMGTAVDGRFYISVSNADSGWGDGYTPTVEEIRAYFMGWKMWQGDSNDSNIPYTSGTKRWRSLTSGDEPSFLPTTQAPNWTPYQLVYQLATPTVEPIISEGMLTFNEGDNQVEVGTGIVVRESAKPVNAGDGTFWINGRTSPSYPLLKKPSKLLSVYKNNLPDDAWMSRPVDAGYENVYGLVQGRLEVGLFDRSAAYSVTYLMLDKSPIVPFTGSYAANEKAMLQELTDAVQQNATAVSVLMNKKADKDQPGWITPTLLNGWVNFSTDYYGAGYVKTSDGLVFFRGIIRNGPVGQNIFILPPGFRPSKTLILDAISHNNSTYIASAIRVYPDGRVFLDVGSFYHLSLESINPFLAEQ